MTNDTIISNLTARFAAPLPDFYKRRIVFWHDEEQSFGEFIDTVDIPGVKVLKLTGSNTFAAKQLLSEDDLLSSYLVYDPLTHNDVRENWLLDIELYSETFRADLLSMRMDELGLPHTVQMRKAVSLYKRFFDNQTRVAKLRAMASDYGSVGQLHLNVMAVLTGAEKNGPADILRAVLAAGLDEEENEPLQAVAKFGDAGVFWDMAAKYAGYRRSEGGRLIELAAHITLTALSASVKEGFFAGLEHLIAEPEQAHCYALVNEWLHCDRTDDLLSLCREVERFVSLPERMAACEPGELLGAEVFPCINEAILAHYLGEIAEGVVKAEEIIHTVEKRRTLKWYADTKPYFEGILQVAGMQRFYQEHASGFHVARYQDLWKAYRDEYYAMDTCYRLFHTAFGESLKQSCPQLEDAFKSTADFVEGLYKNWFLKDLAARWTALIRDALQRDGKLEGIDFQGDFYLKYVQPLLNTGKGGRVFVIISDALRYEVAAELAGQLTRETRGKVSVSAMQSVLPSITKYGMPALLPHTGMSLDENGKPLCDGLSTMGTDGKQKVLNYSGVSGLAITYKRFIAYKEAERKELLEGKQVVYITHNIIDSTGEMPATEDKVFDACRTAIAELKALVRMLNKYTNILITSDHGFLYSYKPLDEMDKAGKDYVDGTIYESDRRYIIADEHAKGTHLLQIPMTAFGSKRLVMVPQDNIRFKTAGGMNYVHGGVTLQEMMVPVVVFRNMRTDTKGFVEVTAAKVELTSSSRKISNNVFSLDFYQKEPAGGKIAPGTYEVCFTDAAGKAISDAHTIIADKTSDNSSERVFRVRFTLKGQSFRKTESYYLSILEAGGSGVPEKIAFTIDIAFANDFDF